MARPFDSLAARPATPCQSATGEARGGRSRAALLAAALAGSLLAAGAAHAAEPTLRLCTARKDGLYYAAGEQIAAAAEERGVAVAIVETAGSLFNLAALEARLCDAAIAQADALLRFGDIDRDRSVDLEDPVPLHREFVYLVCRRDGPVAAVGDLAALAGKARVAIGEPGSGSTATWTALTEIAPAYAAVTTRFLGQSVAVTWLMEDRVDCLIYVAGHGTGYMRSIAAAGEDLRLVPVDDPAFAEAKVQGLSPYRFEDIPAGRYPALQPAGEAVRTISVEALVIATKRWADRHAAAHQGFLSAIAAARPAILDRAGQEPAPDGPRREQAKDGSD